MSSILPQTFDKCFSFLLILTFHLLGQTGWIPGNEFLGGFEYNFFPIIKPLLISNHLPDVLLPKPLQSFQNSFDIFGGYLVDLLYDKTTSNLF